MVNNPSSPKVSVIIPVYGVEAYIERCARSLFEQTLKELEYVFVDDCSPDSSIEILRQVIEEYPHRRSQIKIVRMPSNGKQAAARNMGLEHVTGEYVIHCDPDDWIENTMYEKLYDKAVNEDADIAVCDFTCIKKTGSEYVIVDDSISNPIEAIKNNIAGSSYMLWNRIVRRKLINDFKIRFFDGINFMEDKTFLVRCYLVANKIAFVHEGLYNYNCLNDSSICNTSKQEYKFKQRIEGCTALEAWFGNRAIEFQDYFDCCKWLIKDDILRMKNYTLWRATFPELNKSIMTNPHIPVSFSYRLFCQLAVWHITWPFDFVRWIKKLTRKFLKVGSKG